MQAPRPRPSDQERLQQLENDNRQLQRQVEQARFNKRLKKRIETEPKRSGRKAGSDFGEPSFRPVPLHVDEVLRAPVSRLCRCGGTVPIPPLPKGPTIS